MSWEHTCGPPLRQKLWLSFAVSTRLFKNPISCKTGGQDSFDPKPMLPFSRTCHAINSTRPFYITCILTSNYRPKIWNSLANRSNSLTISVLLPEGSAEEPQLSRHAWCLWLDAEEWMEMDTEIIDERSCPNIVDFDSENHQQALQH